MVETPAQSMAKASRRTAIATAFSILVVLASLLYSANQLNKKQDQIREADAALDRKRQELQKVEAQIKELKASEQVFRNTLSDLGTQSNALAIKTDAAFQSAIAANPSAARLLPRVYLHIREESQRQKAKPIVEALIAVGFSVPGIEYVGAKAPAQTQLRYFQPWEEVQADCTPVLKVLADHKITARRSQIDPGPSGSSMRPRHYEIWFGKDF